MATIPTLDFDDAMFYPPPEAAVKPRKEASHSAAFTALLASEPTSAVRAPPAYVVPVLDEEGAATATAAAAETAPPPPGGVLEYKEGDEGDILVVSRAPASQEAAYMSLGFVPTSGTEPWAVPDTFFAAVVVDGSVGDDPPAFGAPSKCPNCQFLQDKVQKLQRELLRLSSMYPADRPIDTCPRDLTQLPSPSPPSLCASSGLAPIDSSATTVKVPTSGSSASVSEEDEAEEEDEDDDDDDAAEEEEEEEEEDAEAQAKRADALDAAKCVASKPDWILTTKTSVEELKRLCARLGIQYTTPKPKAIAALRQAAAAVMG